MRAGSKITQDERLAREFSHKPTLVSVNDDGAIAHNGYREGMLYRVAEPVREDDLVPVQHSTLGTGKEWLIQRPLRVVAIGRVPDDPRELLAEDEEAALWRQ